MRPRLLLSIAAVLVAGLVTTSAQADLPFAKAETVGMSSKRLERINAFIKDYIDTNQIAGAVTLVARKGKIVHFESQGWRVQGREPADGEGRDLLARVDDQADRVDRADDAVGRRQVPARRSDLEVAAVVREQAGARPADRPDASPRGR